MRISPVLLQILSLIGPPAFAADTVVEKVFESSPPSTFDELIERITEASGPEYGEKHLEVPDGRSLVRTAASDSHPRTIGAVMQVKDESPSTNSNPPTFFGYAADGQSAELLAWSSNPKGHYEFYVVENLGNGKKPVLTKHRGLCIACHQNEGPILSRAPWRELFLPGDATANSQVTRAYQPATKLEKNGNVIALAAIFDSVVRSADEELQKRKICEELCRKDDWRCKASLLGAALREAQAQPKLSLPAGVFSFPHFSQDYPEIQEFVDKYLDTILKKGFARPSSVVPDREPRPARFSFSSPERGEETQVLMESQGAGPARTSPLNYRNDLTTIDIQALVADAAIKQPRGEPQHTYSLKTIYGNVEETDPITKRPLVTDLFLPADTSESAIQQKKNVVVKKLVNMAKVCFQLERADIDKLHLPEGNLGEKILENPLHRLALSPWPPKKESLIAFLKNDPEGLGNALCEEMPEKNGPAPAGNLGKIAEAISGISAFFQAKDTRALKTLKRSCSECHEGQAPRPLANFELPLDDLSALKDYTGSKAIPGIVRKYIEEGLMPPKDAKSPLSESERKALVEVLK
jgi:hypothetical protein